MGDMGITNIHTDHRMYIEGVPKSFRTELVMKYKLTTIKTHSKATQMVMVAKLTILTHKIALELHLVAEGYTVCSSSSRKLVRQLLVTPSYVALYRYEAILQKTCRMSNRFFFFIIPYAFFRRRIFLFYLWILLDIW
jgi:hypothetical protein